MTLNAPDGSVTEVAPAAGLPEPVSPPVSVHV
jgi:hypothetical protein